MFAKISVPVTLVTLVVALAGCAVKPADKVAHGEDHNLIAKEALLGRPLAEVSAAEKLEAGVPLAKAALSAEILALATKVEDGSTLVFEISESYVTVNKVDAHGQKPVLQFAVKGHYDLTNKSDAEGVKSQYLGKDDTAHARWQDREYVEVDPAAPLLIKADEATLRDLYAVESLKEKELVFHTAADLKWLAPEDRAHVAKAFALKDGDRILTTLSRRFLTILKVEANGTRTIMAQATVSYVDLVRQKNSNEEETSTLVRDTQESDWNRRTYVAVATDTAVIATPSANLMEHLYDKKALAGKVVKLGAKDAPLLNETVDLAALIAQSALPVKLGDEVSYRVTEKSVDVLKGKDVILKYAVLSHVDIAPMTNDFGETTAVLALNTTNRAWKLRQYVQVDARDAEVALLDRSITENRVAMLSRAAVKGKCFGAAESPIYGLKDLVTPNAKVCLEVSQTVVSVFVEEGGKRRLVLTYDVEANYDVAQEASTDGKETSSVLTKSTRNPHWEDRAYLDVSVNAPHVVENRVQPNALAKAMLDGEFVYTAVVTAAHSENGLVFTGSTLQAPDRLKFELDAGTLTAYKAHEKLNDSAAKTPVLRFSSSTFDVQRARNGYGDQTNVIEENRDNPWQARQNVRVDFASNQIVSYFNDMLGLEKYYYGIVFTAQSRMVGDVKIDADTISYETEEVVTPNYLAGFSGDGETRFEPTAVKIRHTFLRMGDRSYVAKDYQAIDFAKFGFFETTEAGIDPILGKTDDTLKHFMRRYDISGGKHIAYALSPNFPEKYKPSARKVVEAWNVAFKAATGRDNVMTLDESGTKDVADPRVSMMVFVDQRHTSEPLGYGPSVYDPATGENISGKAYIYKESIQLVMNMASDYYDLATGARTVTDLSSPSATMRGADVGSASARTTGEGRLISRTPLARALPKTRVEALRLTRAVPTSLKLEDTMAKLHGQSSIASAALKSEATAAFDKIAAEYRAKATAARFQGCAMDPEAHIVSAVKFILNHPGMSKSEVLASLEESMMFSLLLHEVGHTLGLRHNFHGSFDEASFPAKYFEAKAANGWTEQFRTSSTMDYLDDFEATDLSAGPYDVAAIKFGYGDKLEKIIGQDEFGALITEDMPKAEFDAAVQAIKAQNPAASMNAVNAAAMAQLDVRPFKFCSDEHTEDDPTCNRFDRGITVEELTKSLIQEYDTRYELYAFRRGRRDFTGASSSVIGRYIMPVRRLLDEYVFNIINNSFPTQDNFDGSPNPGSPSDYVSAINAGIDFYNKLLETVEPGVYHLDAKTGELVSGRSEEEGAKNVLVDLKTGKYLLPRVEVIGGRDEVVQNRGVELDKIGVLYAMGLRGYPATKYERAQLAVNYFDLIKEFTVGKFSGVIREDAKVDLVTALGEDGLYHPITDPTVAFDPANPAQLKAKIAPSSSLAIREYAMIFATNFDNAGNRSFGDYVDYRLKGIDAVFPAATTTAEFTSALGTKTYVVANTADDLSISFKIAAKAQESQAKIQAARDALAQLPDASVLKSQAISKFGEAWAIGNGQPMGDNIVQILEGNFEPNIPVVRLLTDQFVAGTTDPEQLAKVTTIRDELNAILDQFEALAGDRKALEDAVDSGNRELTGYESDLIHLKDMYQIFK